MRRIQGADRYETSKNFAAWACGLEDHEGDWVDPDNSIRIGTVGRPDAIQPLNPNGVGVASGVNYPDALGAACSPDMASRRILLTRRMMSPIFDLYGTLGAGVTDYRADVITTTGNGVGLGRCYLFGGTAAVADSVYGESRRQARSWVQRPRETTRTQAARLSGFIPNRNRSGGTRRTSS